MSAQPYISLSQLTAEIRDTIRYAFADVYYWVLADVVDHKFYSQKSCHYFSLAEKDKNTKSLKAKVAAVAWSDDGAAAIEQFEEATGQPFTNGIQVLVQVSVNYSPAYGLQLILHDIDPAYTIGMLEQQRRATLADLVRLCPDYIRLVGNEYQTRNNSLIHATVIQRIAVITSANAAGYTDFQDTLAKNRHGYAIRTDPYFTTIQGEAHAEAFCQRLIDIYQSGKEYDAVVIIRGGGSQTDLLIFDQFIVARAVAKFPIPIICGIGHQINETIADLMAHTSVKTPSIAAEFILGHNWAFEEEVIDMHTTVALKAQQLIASQQRELAHMGHDIVTGARQVAAGAKAALQASATGIKQGAGQMLLRQKKDLRYHEAVARMADPHYILKRGFALVYHKGAVIGNGGILDAGDDITIRMAGATLEATITTKTTDPTHAEPDL